MTNQRLHAIVLLLVACLLATPAFAAPFPGASGMALLDKTHYLCVQDVKADKPDARFGVLAVDAQSGKQEYTALSNPDWAGQDPANDLESLSAIPGQPGEFLAAESGYWEGKFGRIWRVQAGPEGAGWRVHVMGTLALPKLPGEVEGIACAAGADGKLRLIVSERGGQAAYWPGFLHTYSLDLAAGTLTAEGDEAVTPGPRYSAGGAHSIDMQEALANPFGRALSDIYLDPLGQLWGAAAVDNGDAGPFRSYVFRIGYLDTDGNIGQGGYGSNPVWHLDGVKVEALCGPCTPGAVLSFATDDENYGGIWRPLGPATWQGQSSYFY